MPLSAWLPRKETGLVALKWLGFLLVAGSLGVLPFAIWISNDLGLVSALAGLVGLALLGIALPRRRAEPVEDDSEQSGEERP